MKTKSISAQQNSAALHPTQESNTGLVFIAAWIKRKELSFWVGSIGLAVMLIWGGLFKLTAQGADGITPMVTHSPLIGWHFKVFGPYVGADIIGVTEMLAAVLILAGHFIPKAGIAGSLIASFMFFLTSTLFISTPGTVAQIGQMWYMTVIGLFLFKDIIALSLSFYLVGAFGKRAN